MQAFMTIWALGALIIFIGGLAMTPTESSEASALFWLAVLAVLWPLIVAFSAIGLLLTLLAGLTRNP